ncbi:MBL fold metallo-hydrolase [Flavobacterium sp. NKUCC04_CG]|uniref:MBL fold metallo-hydrolase n=1 Tax=Flavobacterium sp. NKUCC04_CG TaxID=2842121 RepID=UPI001C5BAEC2|nr:3',5'-cyclic-nucleotide phosphodiesterase [Flavobacterium sp. NKUCC04_CG]MBW3517590.1 3',5'-cyclic-nucleotide phosphodiesterase [Flavobacterium sp. NKUCC04_CG]
MKKLFLFLLLPFHAILWSQSFELVPLGVYGGGDESNLSAYLIGEPGKNAFLALDAGTLRSGIQVAIANQTFTATEAVVLKSYIKGYFISHGHLDHLAGLIINSPDDSKKNIYAMDYVIDIFKKYYFTNGPWSNFANEGASPVLNKYTYKKLDTQTKQKIENTGLQIEAFELSHGDFSKSSAVLVENNVGAVVLYLGDTGADRIEKSDNLARLWKNTAPLLQSKKLKTILIEVSFPNSQPENALYGHLTPKLLVEELQVLESYAGKGSLDRFKVIITHLKPGGDQIETIKKELEENNPLGLDYIFPKQGERLLF